MRKLIVLAATASALALAACGSLPKAAPEPLSVTIGAFAAAGCKVDFRVDVGGEVGQLGGGAHASNVFGGNCDPANAPKPLSATPDGIKAAIVAAGIAPHE